MAINEVHLTVGDEHFDIIPKGYKFQVLHNGKKISELNDIGKANDKLNELAAPYIEKWNKKYRDK